MILSKKEVEEKFKTELLLDMIRAFSAPPEILKFIKDYHTVDTDEVSAVFSTDEEKICKDAITAFGVPRQIKMLTEEIGEILQALNKCDRKGLIFATSIQAPTKLIDLPFQDLMPIKTVLAYHNLCEEIVDVEIILKQIKSVLDQEILKIKKERKLDKLKTKLEKHGNKSKTSDHNDSNA